MRKITLALPLTAVIVFACQMAAPQDRNPNTHALLPDGFNEIEIRRVLKMSPLPALAPDPTNRWSDDNGAARLGQLLFFDKRLSKGEQHSCATCHLPDHGFADTHTVSEGVARLEHHVPTLLNIAHHRWFFWDGRADSLWSQACAVIESPLEMAGTRLGAAHLVARDELLRKRYQATFGRLPALEDTERFPLVGRPVPADDPAYGDSGSHGKPGPDGQEHHTHQSGSAFFHPHERNWKKMTDADRATVNDVFANIGKALAAYQHRLVTTDSPLDRFVRGVRSGNASDLAALSPSAQRGLQLFVGEANCFLCHSGSLLSDREFHDLRLPPGDGPIDDMGRQHGLKKVISDPFNGRGAWSDDKEAGAELLDYLPQHHHANFEFKTPSLRNVALSPPYMHQGQFATLREVVDFYSELEGVRTSPPSVETVIVPLRLDEDQKQDLVAFLESLTGTLPAATWMNAPEVGSHR
jgi:cytochrome c peroxidase